MKTHSSPVSRRQFVLSGGTALAGGALAGVLGRTTCGLGGETTPPASRIVVFSKIYQSLKLEFEEAADLTAEAGLDGIDCPVRPGGEVLPERVKDDLPRYLELLRKRGLSMPLITSGILNTASPHAEEVLHVATKLGVKYYRLGSQHHTKERSLEEQLAEVKAQLKDLAALSRQIGIGGMLQNHSPSGNRKYIGGDLNEAGAVLQGLDPEQMGVAFDIGHALVVHKEGWREQFEKLRSHFCIAYIKDARKTGRFVRFGDGDIGVSGYFKVLKEMSYRRPFSLHIEYDWDDQGKRRNRETLLKVLRESAARIREWVATA